jgi:hypothetical protein
MELKRHGGCNLSNTVKEKTGLFNLVNIKIMQPGDRKNYLYPAGCPLI